MSTVGAWAVPDGAVALPVTTVVGRVDGAEVSVGVQPGARAGCPVVLLRVSSPLLETVAGAYLGADEADWLAAALSAAACAARTPGTSAPGPSAPGPSPGERPGVPHRAAPAPPGGGSGAGVCPAGAAVPACTGPVPGECAGYTEITAVEGTGAAELSAAIGLLPAGTMLIDFSADADVCLIFGPPPPHGHPDEVPAGQRLGPPAAAA